MVTVDWAELVPDLLSLIVKKLNLYEDFTAFSGVCRSWRSVAVKNNFSPVQVPWLLLAPPKNDHLNDSRDFYSLTKGGMVHTVHLPEARGKKLLTCLGWLITMDTYRGDMELLHPLSRARIPLPNVRSKFDGYYVGSDIMFSTAALSASPSDTNDYTLMMFLVRPASLLAYWKPGNTDWVTVKTSRSWMWFSFVVYHSGLFYAISHPGELFSIDINGPDPTTTTTTVNLIGTIPRKVLKGTDGCYLAESGGDLLAVVKKCLHDDDQRSDRVVPGLSTHYHHGTGDCKLTNKPIYNYMTTSFKVYRFDSSNNKWHVMNDLGGRSLIIGQGSAPVSVPCVVGAIRPDCIYFTDDTNLHYTRKDDGCRMGVYSLKELRADTLYKGGTSRGRCFNCRLLWVVPSF